MTEEEMLVFAKNNSPDLFINSVQTNSDGWDNDILILNEKLVFRFPKSNAVLSKIEDEGKILENLKGKKPLLLIPNYEYLYEGRELRGVKYGFLEGISLSELPVNNLRGNPYNARGIGDFLSKLHRIDITDLNHSNIGTIHSLKYWESLHKKVEIKLFPFLTSKQQKEINEVFNRFLNEFSNFTNEKTIIHGDLTASNIIYSQEKESINGIIDFTDAQIGDPAFDFAGLYWAFGMDFTKDVLGWYTNIENKEFLLDRVKKFYGLQPVFHELLYAIENDQKINWKTALNKFSALNQLAK
ncbi:aminoglycoside phosphotransferase family protein [Planococcus faecalis]|uniref:Aminoglycoside phosphotransferase domain-containing protein n=1 Tax=Planococcus faecalis TaxID=1598147 RepID=A0ABM6ISI8_9BACL|nr:aminoglycoside phosphotransferase family protein [Planococcus faecalis]AQU79556.1 hypothetical protein AJGP001_09925 [Planococcus faecalis]OHX53174.1 hypothetical protein BB777_10975 [Planococcus faecalis]